MLSELRVEHLGIVDEISLVLGAGMTVITGETGAGKTLLVEALELLVGGRAHSGPVPPRDAEPPAGGGAAYWKGGRAPAAELAGLGGRLVDLHGKHEHQSLLEPASQRRALD